MIFKKPKPASEVAVIEKVTKEKQTPIYRELAEMFLHAGVNRVFSYKEVVDFTDNIRRRYNLPIPKRAGHYVDLYTVIGGARKELELAYSKTIFNVGGKGYKLANEFEQTYFAAKTYKRLMILAARTKRLAPLIITKYLPEAHRKAFGPVENARGQLEMSSMEFIPAFKVIDETAKKKI